ncbi:MAG: hypothetical protein WDO70_06235 [Alphaproteobacteria bacterium]
MKNLSHLLIVLALLCGTLAACGVKPQNVDPPPGASGTFPRTYPSVTKP